MGRASKTPPRRDDPFATAIAHEVGVRGVRLRCLELGEGPPLVLLHGFLVNHKEWRGVVPTLANHFRCLVPDLPGCGRSDRPAPDAFPYSWNAFADAVVELTKALGASHFQLAGHSMGGGIALNLAARYPDRVERLSLVDAESYPFDVPLKGRIPLVPGIGPLVFERLYGRALFRDYFVNDVWSGRPGIDLATVDEYYDDFDDMPARRAAHATFVRTLADLGAVTGSISRVRCPTLVVWGEHDRIFPVGFAHRLAREIPGATLRILPAAHAPNEELAEECSKRLLAHHLALPPSDAPSPPSYRPRPVP